MTELTPNELPRGQSCGTCRFAGTNVIREGTDRTLVSCRRYPPTRVETGDRYNHTANLSQQAEATRWPVLTWDDWCGEWRERWVPA